MSKLLTNCGLIITRVFSRDFKALFIESHKVFIRLNGVHDLEIIAQRLRIYLLIAKTPFEII